MSEGLKPCPHRQVDDTGRILCGLIRGGDREVSVNLCRACPVPQINCQHLRASMQKKVSTPITVRFATGRVEVWDDEPATIGFKRAACAEKTMPINSPRDCQGCPLRAALVVPQNAIQVARRNKPAAAPAALQAEPPPPVPAQPPARPIVSTPPSIITEIPAQPVAQASAVPEAIKRTPPKAEAQAEPSGAAQELVQRAQELAAKKYRESRRAQAAATQPTANAPAQAEPSENKSKIILLQQWLADQFNKKNAQEKPAAPQPDADGVQDIVYSPLAPTYNEESGYERCVGWTD